MTPQVAGDRRNAPRSRVALLRAVVALSGVYDVALGVAMLLALDDLARLLDLPAPLYPIHANLNGLFALAIGIGYFSILRRPQQARWYLWVMGPFLKGAGAILLLLDFVLRGSPASFLAFAAADAVVASLNGFALVRTAGTGAPEPDVPAETG